MGGLVDFLLSLVNVLCGGSTTQEQPSQIAYGERPQQHAVTLPGDQELRVSPEYRRPEHESKPIPQPHPDRKSQQDQNQINQHDEHYLALRAKANQEGDLMSRCFQESHEAYARRDGARAKELSQQGKQHGRRMESLNAEASAWIFRQNNLDSKPGEINLHGLYVKEAISYVEKSVQDARQRGDTEIRLIVGKGLHSNGHVKIKPAVEDLMRKHNIPTEIDPYNGGVLIAQLC